MIWDFLISIMLIVVIFFLTFEISFMQERVTFFKVVEYVTFFVFILDIFFNFNRVYITKNKRLVVQRKQIASNYLKCWFWVDLVAAIPFFAFENLISQDSANLLKNVKVLRVVSIIRLFRLLKIIKNVFGNKGNQQIYHKKIKVKDKAEKLLMNISIVFLVCHLFACVFYALPTNFSKESNWLVSRGLEDASITEKYLYSMHWIVETVITVGYGENPIT